MSTDIRQIKQEAEQAIEEILQDLSDEGLPVFRIQVMDGTCATIIFDEKGGQR